jgi:hypothetical protein
MDSLTSPGFPNSRIVRGGAHQTPSHHRSGPSRPASRRTPSALRPFPWRSIVTSIIPQFVRGEYGVIRRSSTPSRRSVGIALLRVAGWRDTRHQRRPVYPHRKPDDGRRRRLCPASRAGLGVDSPPPRQARLAPVANAYRVARALSASWPAPSPRRRRGRGEACPGPTLVPLAGRHRGRDTPRALCKFPGARHRRFTSAAVHRAPSALRGRARDGNSRGMVCSRAFGSSKSRIPTPREWPRSCLLCQRARHACAATTSVSTRAASST